MLVSLHSHASREPLAMSSAQSVFSILWSVTASRTPRCANFRIRIADRVCADMLLPLASDLQSKIGEWARRYRRISFISAIPSMPRIGSHEPIADCGGRHARRAPTLAHVWSSVTDLRWLKATIYSSTVESFTGISRHRTEGLGWLIEWSIRRRGRNIHSRNTYGHTSLT